MWGCSATWKSGFSPRSRNSPSPPPMLAKTRFDLLKGRSGAALQDVAIGGPGEQEHQGGADRRAEQAVERPQYGPEQKPTHHREQGGHGNRERRHGGIEG